MAAVFRISSFGRRSQPSARRQLLRIDYFIWVETSQTRAVPSLLPETNVLPSADQASEETVPRCPSKRGCSLPVAMSHRRMVGSQPAVANVRPFGEMAMD